MPIVNVGFGDGQGDCNGIGPLHPDPNLPLCPTMFAPVSFNQPNGWTPVTGAVVDYLNNPPALELTVDGIPLQNPTAYRALAPQFTYALPHNSVFSGHPAGTYGPAGSDGYWVMLTPLPPGRHTIHFRTGDGFQDVLYNLTVGNER